MRLAPGASVVAIVRLRLADGVPVAIERASFGAALASGLAAADLDRGSLHRILLDLGHVPSRGRATLAAEPAGTADAKLLGLKKGDAVLVERRLIDDQHGAPLELTESRYAGDRYGLEVRFVVEPAAPVKAALRRQLSGSAAKAFLVSRYQPGRRSGASTCRAWRRSLPRARRRRLRPLSLRCSSCALITSLASSPRCWASQGSAQLHGTSSSSWLRPPRGLGDVVKLRAACSGRFSIPDRVRRAASRIGSRGDEPDPQEGDRALGVAQELDVAPRRGRAVHEEAVLGVRGATTSAVTVPVPDPGSTSKDRTRSASPSSLTS